VDHINHSIVGIQQRSLACLHVHHVNEGPLLWINLKRVQEALQDQEQKLKEKKNSIN